LREKIENGIILKRFDFMRRRPADFLSASRFALVFQSLSGVKD
jgi:hypothetical protein